MSNPLQNYADSWSDADVDREVNEATNEKSEESTFLSLDDGEEVAFRVLPNPTGSSPIHRFAKHFYQDPVTGKWISFACPAKSKLPGHRYYECPVCKQAAQLMRSRFQAERDVGYKMRAKWKGLINILVRPDDALVQEALDEGLDEPVGTVKLWEISSWAGKKNGRNMHEELIAIRQSRAGGNFVDPTANGFDLLLSRQGEKLDTRYRVQALAGHRRPLLTDPVAASNLITEGQIDVEAFISPPTQQELAQILQGEKPKRNREMAPPDSRAALSSGPSADDVIDVDGEDGYGPGGATGAGFQ